MAFKPPAEQPDFSRLQIVLLNARLQTSNNALYQVISELIKRIGQSRDMILIDIEDVNSIINQILQAQFLTSADESALLPNSRELLAGTNITFDDTIANQRTISASGGSGSAYYDSPLSDGDLVEADLIFANGDPITVQIPNVP